MRVTYIAKTPDKEINSGVNKKLISQTKELIAIGVDAKLILIGKMNTRERKLPNFISTKSITIVPWWNIKGRVNNFLKIRKIIRRSIISSSYNEIIYLRYLSPLACFQIKFLKPFRDCIIVLEHQTMEIKEFKLNKYHVGKSIYYVNIFIEHIFGKSIRRNSDAVIGVTNEITQYQLEIIKDFNKPNITSGNGFEVESVLTRKPPQFKNELHLLIVAYTNRWHGLDRLLRGIAAYSGTPDVMLHIAGDGSELPHLQKLTNELGIGNRVIFHGFTTGKDLDDLFNTCHIAVGSLGIHRKGLTQTSELKVREYCARGIPWIIACKDPDFPEDFPYIHRIPADESPVNMDEVVKFAEKACSDPDHPVKMRSYAFEHLDWSVKMKKLKTFLEALVGESPSIS